MVESSRTILQPSSIMFTTSLKQQISRGFCQGCGFPASLEHLSCVGPASTVEARKLALSASLADRFTRDLGFFHQTYQGKTLIQKWATWRSRKHMESTFWWGWHWLPAFRGPGIRSSASWMQTLGPCPGVFTWWCGLTITAGWITFKPISLALSEICELSKFL